jgi:hypothetical protein
MGSYKLPMRMMYNLQVAHFLPAVAYNSKVTIITFSAVSACDQLLCMICLAPLYEQEALPYWSILFSTPGNAMAVGHYTPDLGVCM